MSMEKDFATKCRKENLDSIEVMAAEANRPIGEGAPEEAIGRPSRDEYVRGLWYFLPKHVLQHLHGFSFGRLVRLHLYPSRLFIGYHDEQNIGSREFSLEFLCIIKSYIMNQNK